MDNYLKMVHKDVSRALFGLCCACGADNFADSRFCCQCGKPLNKYMMVLRKAVSIVNNEIECETDDKHSIHQAACQVLEEFGRTVDSDYVNEATIVAGLKKEFADHEFPKESTQKRKQLNYLKELGIKLQYEETAPHKYDVAVDTALGSVCFSMKTDVMHPTPGDITQRFYLDDPTPIICELGLCSTNPGAVLIERHSMLRSILTDEQVEKLRQYQSCIDRDGVWEER